MKIQFGTLEKVDPRDYWKNEARDFTPWLAEEQNIERLSETVGMELEVQGREEKVGSFSADILCKDTITDHYVVIENQLEKTDHTHLGQLITYCSGLNACCFIWIARSFTEEHRAAIDWLNGITDDKFNFFGIEIELYRIGDSQPAPKFTIVSKPNGWSKNVRTQVNNGPLSDTRTLQLEYWTAFKEYIDQQPESPLRSQKPAPQHWTDFAIGSSLFSLSTTVNSRDKQIMVWLYIKGDKAKENFDKLRDQFAEASRLAIDQFISWNRLDNKKNSVVTTSMHADFTDREDWPNQFAGLYQTLIKYYRFFKPHIRTLK